MAVVCRGTSDIQGHDSWRIPFGLFFIVPTIVACGVWFTDEVRLLSALVISSDSHHPKWLNAKQLL
jgi:hypothetical protein